MDDRTAIDQVAPVLPRLAAHAMREHMDTRTAAGYLGCSESWLAASRGRGDGPPFYKLGRRIRYMRSALDEWARGRQVSSTVEARMATT